jgi:hypothetical protein
LNGLIRRGSQVVRPRSAKPLFTGSIPVPAFFPLLVKASFPRENCLRTVILESPKEPKTVE